MAELTKERKGEIALIILKEKLFKDGITLSQNTLRHFREDKKKLDELGISQEESIQLLEETVREFVDRIFDTKERKAERAEKQRREDLSSIS